jgi:hypothetical protein
MKIEATLRGLGVFYGREYGRAFYSAANESVASDVQAKYDFNSFEELAKLLLDPAAFRYIDGGLWHAAAHYRVRIAQAAAVVPLNVTARTPGVTPAVLAAAIDMRQVFYQRQALFFALDAAEGRSAAHAVAGLATYHLLAAAAREERRRHEVELVIVGDPGYLADLDPLLHTPGVHVTLVHSHLGQLTRPDRDDAETLEAVTGLQVVFRPSGRRVRRWIAETAGTVTRPQVAWSQTLSGGEATDDDFHLSLADAARDDLMPRARVTEREAAAVTENDLARWAATPGLALVRLVADPGRGPGCYGGAWIPTETGFHVSKAEYEARRDSPWPVGGPGTIWVPPEAEYDKRFKAGRPPSAAKQQLQKQIRTLRSRKGQP